jgi:type II secretory pathway pseudopilin PulG
MNKTFSNQKGQLLIEILIAIAVVALIIGATSNLFLVNFKNSRFSEGKNDALLLAQEAVEAMGTITENDWHNIYLPPMGNGNKDDKGESFVYCIKNVSSAWTITGSFSDCEIILNGKKYTRKINIFNVNRTDAEISETGEDDPSTQKIRVAVSYADGKDIVLEKYLTRWENDIFIQSDWLGGSGSQGPFDASNTIDVFDSGLDIDNSPGGIRLAPL